MSLLSLQLCSSKTLQSLPSQPLSHLHSHIPSLLNRHCPCAEQLFGHPSMVQCFPFHPVTHKQVPFLHCPCSLHLGSHCFKLQYSPDHPESHWQESDTQCPCCPQSRSQSSVMPNNTQLDFIRDCSKCENLWSNRLQTNGPRTCKFVCPSRKFHVRNSWEDTEEHLCPFDYNQRLSNPSYRCKSLRRSNHDRYMLDADSQLCEHKHSFRTKS